MVNSLTKVDPTITLHRITTAQFASALMQVAKSRRLMKKGRRKFRLLDLAMATGYNYTYLSWWQTGRRQPTLVEALDCLQAVAEAGR